jgi:lysophospholipase L1-like esterase
MTHRTILCFGDSNTWGYNPETGQRYPRNGRWPHVMAQQLGKAYEVIAEGQPGRTTVWQDPIEGLRCGKEYLIPCLQSHAPLDLVIILLGTNDLKYRFSLTATDIALGAQTLIEIVNVSRAGNNGRSPFTLLVAPPRVIEFPGSWEAMSGAQEKSERLPALYQQVAAKNGAHFFDANAVICSSLVDGFHWDAESQVRLGQALRQKVLDIFS